ncbi:tetratricopeptide repeat protein 17 isoform X1 [Periplaneta americana]|uniref:tetratricopeptide repeat protein 17 isoform X1 n=1 Tax=Periplaneta americana TaxID=6978 RepID=UPI0037E88AE1
MVELKSWKVFAVLFEIFLGISASTHWVVTENGRVQSQLDSAFHLRRPYDLLALLEQERRVRNIDTLYKELVSRKTAIDRQWASLEGATDLEARLYSHDADCLRAGRPLSDTDLYPSLAGDVRDRIRLDRYLPADVPADGPMLPFCTHTFSLDFSMHAFEHLHAMVVRANLSASPELSLVSHVLGNRDVTQFGRQVALGLERNSTSWLHHNLAAIYWRIRGDAPNAVECARKAVHYAPRQYKDLALLNLGAIFHQARFPAEAAIILHAAVDHAPLMAQSHFLLGNVYAVLGDYNRSIACYDNAMKLRPSLDQVTRTKHSVLCHRKLEKGLLDLHESLQFILAELHDYHSKQEQWLKHQEKLIWEQAPLDVRLLGQDHNSLTAMLSNRGQSCMQRIQDGRPVLSCDVNSESQLLAHSLQIDITLSLQMLLKNVESQAKKISEQMSRRGHLSPEQLAPVESTSSLQQDEDNMQDSEEMLGDNIKYHSPTVAPIYPYIPEETVGKTGDAVPKYEEEDWPSQEECTALTSPDNFPPVFLPPENKGFEVHLYLGQLIDLTPGMEHALPWYPPLCSVASSTTNPELEAYFPASLSKDGIADDSEREASLRPQLTKYVSEGRNMVEEEIGQRILTAINKGVGPKWLLQTLASLYWRVRGNSRNAIDCLRVAFTSVPKEFRDVVLVSLGSLMHKLGHLDEALNAASEALTINTVEPATHFLLASVLEGKGNHTGAIHHLKQVLSVDPDFLEDGRMEKYLLAITCNLKFSNMGSTTSTQDNPEEMCGASSGIQGGKQFDVLNGIEGLKEGETVLCSPDGEQCRAVQCFSATQDTGGIVTLEPAAVSRLMALGTGGQCADSHSLLSNLLAVETGSGGKGPWPAASLSEQLDETELERMTDDRTVPKVSPHEQFHLRISLGEEGSLRSAPPLGDFYVPVSLTDDPLPDTWLHVYDKSGTYPLSPGECDRIRSVDWDKLATAWYSASVRHIRLGSQLPTLSRGSERDLLQPHCEMSLPPSPMTMDHIAAVRLRHRLHVNPEPGIAQWLGVLAGDENSSTQELGTRIALALQENATSWVLATAAALYWRVIGHADQAITCLQQALQLAPSPDRDIPLVSLATMLHRAGFYSDALTVANLALELAPKFEVTHFTVANIHASVGDLEKAIAFYRSSLALRPGFEPARSRLQSILCSLLFDSHTVKTGP